jgi:hypothetical protein
MSLGRYEAELRAGEALPTPPKRKMLPQAQLEKQPVWSMTEDATTVLNKAAGLGTEPRCVVLLSQQGM